MGKRASTVDNQKVNFNKELERLCMMIGMNETHSRYGVTR